MATKNKTSGQDSILLDEFVHSIFFRLWQKYCDIRDGRKKQERVAGREITPPRKLKKAKAFRMWLVIRKVRTFLGRIFLWPVFKLLKKMTPWFIKDRLKIIYFNLKAILNLYEIDQDILKEWKSWNGVRKKSSKDIFIFSIIAYNYRHQRPQHLAEQLAKYGHRIFYIQQEFIAHKHRLHSSLIDVFKIDTNIYTVSLSADKNLFIYRDTPSVKDKELIKRSLKELILRAEVINPIAKIDHPFWANILDEIAMPVVYDCMDEHSGFRETSDNNEKLEKELFTKSDLILITSAWLENKAKKYKKRNVVMLRNAGDYNHFKNAAGKKLEVPKELKKLKKPIIGYYGAISSWFDTEILNKVAEKFKDASIVLIGRLDNKQVVKLSRKYKNIYLLGEKTYNELPTYLACFDVCTIPFQLTNLIKATNPVKVYEYLAAGKPVVATNIPELRILGDVVYIAKKKREFVSKLSTALKEKFVNRRQLVARQNTWEKRGEVLNSQIEKIFSPKVSVVIVSYNSPGYINGCLRSVTNSYYPSLEVIVVDNGSSKETLNILEKYTRTGKIKLIKNKKNLGFARGNNIGIKAATGEYIILLNNDTIITPSWVERLVFHANKKDVGLVGPVTNNIGNEAKIDIEYNPNSILELRHKALKYTSFHWGETMEVGRIAAFCWIGRKSLYRKVGDMDERFGKGLFEDDDYCIRVKKLGKKILIADDVFVHHWGGGTTKWQTPEYQKLFNENKKKFEEKWGIKWQPHKYRDGLV